MENDAFLAALRSLADRIRKSLCQRSKAGQAPRGEDLEEHHLEALRSALAGMDIAATNRLIVKYLELPLNERAKKTLSDIENHILLFDYDKAIEKIDSFAEDGGKQGHVPNYRKVTA
jgi:hypothetical protein